VTHPTRRGLAALWIVALAACSTGEQPGTAATPQPPKWRTGDWQLSCRYDTGVLPELSGLTASQRHRGVLWALNDSGNAPTLVALDVSTCAVRGTATMNVPNTDWEGLAAGTRKGKPVLFIADIGNNTRARTQVNIIEVPEPALGATTVGAAMHPFSFPDGPTDAEGIMARGKKVWVVSKQLAGSVYRVNLKKGTANEVGSAPSFATDAAMSPTADIYAIRDYPGIQLFRGLPPGDRVGRSTPPQQPQAEAVAFSADGRWLYTASESDRRLVKAAVQPT
jgi:hypothetical protein